MVVNLNAAVQFDTALETFARTAESKGRFETARSHVVNRVQFASAALRAVAQLVGNAFQAILNVLATIATAAFGKSAAYRKAVVANLNSGKEAAGIFGKSLVGAVICPHVANWIDKKTSNQEVAPVVPVAVKTA